MFNKKVMSKAVVSFFGSDAIYVWKIIWFISCVKSDFPVLCLYLMDILDKLPIDDARVSFIHENLTQINQQLIAVGASLLIKTEIQKRFGKPINEFDKEVFF
jgi:deoxyribodipyrimidine photo-lyase